jgi:cobalt/nickel transport system permease protein
MLVEQMGQMFTAADCRLGFVGMRRSLQTSGLIIANLFSRSMDFAERADAALQCRGFNGNFQSFRQPARLGARWVLLSIISFAALFMAGRAASGMLMF